EPDPVVPPSPEPEPAPAARETAPTPPPAAPRAAPRAEPPPAPAPSSGGMTLVEVRRLWPDVVDAAKDRRRVTWMHLSQNSQVVGVDGNVVTLGFTNAGARDSFVGGGSPDLVAEIASEVLGARWRIEAIMDPGVRPGSPPPPPAAAPVGREPLEVPPADTGPEAEPVPPPPEPVDDDPGPPGRDPGPAQDRVAEARASAREAITATRPAGPPPSAGGPDVDADGGADRDDPDVDDELAGTELLQRELGARVIDEIPRT
ncbi:DNA polymerase III subunit gamma/tau, partial [Nocardioides sp. CFH 31398]|nr:DNA polymerase III subunit gamma/tau [Nocardioides sp. CFH 31398]